jgi:hypothetical protein
MRDEGLAIGQPLVIWMSVVERFIDERPATLVRSDFDDATGAQRLLVRDETNGVLRSFVKRAGAHEFAEAHEPIKRCVVVITDARRDGVVMHERSRVQSCDLCGEPDVFGARGNFRSRCGRCIVPRDCVPATLLATPVDVDLARALLRHELVIEEAPFMRAALAALDGTAPWHIASEPFAQPAWGLGDVLDARARLVEAMWRGELVPGATVEVATNAHDDHPWCSSRGAIAFVVGRDAIYVRTTDEPIAERAPGASS